MSKSIQSICKRLLKVSVKASINTLPVSVISSVPIVGPIAGSLATPILKELVDVIFEQTSSIDQKLDTLIKFHYKVGVKYLRDAGNVDDQMRKPLIEKALDEFAYASELEKEVVRQAQSMFYVGVCYTLIGQHDAALDWYRDAYQKGEEHLVVLYQRVDAGTVGYSQAASFEDKASMLEDLASDFSPNLINTAMKGALRAGPYGPFMALLVGGAGYAALGAIKGGRVIAAAVGASKAKNLSNHEQEMVTFCEHFLKPLEQLLQSRE